MVAFRHILKFVFGCADLYFVAEMSPITEDIVKDDHEIDKCVWMKVEDFLSDPDASPHNKKFVKNYLKCKEMGIKMKMDDTVHDILKTRQLWFTIDNENIPKNDDS
ncbi:uncharacterized protein LOC111064434 [Nilaparvata lugens]|uniref:uncharacterized protein LOC111064434 n=1 Tax=Nilaparvata lugens TaxID=108931 RepID=UPI00193E7DAA|nr:uncharacterized protein LOC111064434 [Nilaparvata lugens]